MAAEDRQKRGLNLGGFPAYNPAAPTHGNHLARVQDIAPTVANAAALTALDVTNLTDAVRRVETYKDIFVLDKVETRTAIANEVIAGNVAGAWWVRQFIRDTYWARKSTWYIDPILGDDENEGDVAGAGNALKTLTEYSRRTDGEPVYSDVAITIGSSLNAGDTRIPHRTGTGVTSGSVVGLKVSYIGILIPIFTGTITAYTARNGSAAQPTLMTIASLPATNTWTSYVGKLVRCDLGGGSVIDGVVVADLGSKQAWISPPVNQNFATTTFTNGQTVTVYDVPSLGTAVVRSFKYDYVDFANLSAGIWEAFGHYNQFSNCVGAVFQYGGTGNYENHSGSVVPNDGNANLNGGKVHVTMVAGTSIRLSSHVTLYAGASPTSAGITCGGGIVSTPRGVGVADVECFNANGLVNFTNASVGAVVGFGGFVYGTVSATDVIIFGTGARQATATFAQTPSFGASTTIDFVDAATTGSLADLATKQVDDVNGNRVIGPAGPNLNDNRSQPIAHLGSGGGVPTSAVNGADLTAAISGISGFVPTARTLTAGAGQTGGGDLSANRTFDVAANADGTIVVNANDIQVGVVGAGNIAAGAVTLAKMANLAAQRLLGNDTGTGAPVALTVTGGVEFTGAGGIQRSALTGHVTAPAGSNVTTVAVVPFAVVQTSLGGASSAVDLNGQQLTGVADPTTAQGAATKNYVDAAIAGFKWKTSVVVATVSAGTLATSFANGQVVNGVTLATGNRILIKDQAAGSENGIYTVNASGAPTRATDADTGAELVSAAVFAQQGTVNADHAYVCTNDTITIGSTSIVFVEFASAVGALIAVNNLSDLTNVATARTNLGLVAIANTGSANDLIAGTIPTARLPAFAGGDVTSAGASLVLTIASHAVTAAKFRQSAGLSVVGVTGSSTADVADIPGTNNQIFRVRSGALGFGSILAADIADLTTGSVPFSAGASGLTEDNGHFQYHPATHDLFVAALGVGANVAGTDQIFTVSNTSTQDKIIFQAGGGPTIPSTSFPHPTNIFVDFDPTPTAVTPGSVVGNLRSVQFGIQQYTNAGASITDGGIAVNVYIEGPPAFTGTWTSLSGIYALYVAAGDTRLGGNLQVALESDFVGNTTVQGELAVTNIARLSGNGTFVLELPEDNTSNATATTGRIPILVNGNNRYLRYYLD